MKLQERKAVRLGSFYRKVKTALCSPNGGTAQARSPDFRAVIAAKGGDKEETIFEISDLAYHIFVLMAEYGITPNDVKAQLASRHVVDKKVKQEKMQ